MAFVHSLDSLLAWRVEQADQTEQDQIFRQVRWSEAARFHAGLSSHASANTRSPWPASPSEALIKCARSSPSRCTETTHFVGMDFDNPNLDMQGIAAGFGARIEKIDKLATIGEVLGRALSHVGPSFLIVDREP